METYHCIGIDMELKFLSVFIIEEKLHFHKQEGLLVYLKFHCLEMTRNIKRHE